MQQPDQAPTVPSLAVGDSIYYRHKEHGVTHGVVASVGQHGCLTDAKDGEHQVRWADFLGHRKRAERKLTIVDRGEDGTLMEDENGKKVFVRGALEDFQAPGQPEPSLLEKAQVMRELSAAGFEPMMDLVKDTFGEQFVYRQPVEASPFDPDAMARLVAVLERTASGQAAQFSGLAAAVALLAERLEASNQIQQQILAALPRPAVEQVLADLSVPLLGTGANT